MIPTSLKIGGHLITIKQVELEEDNGYYESAENTITINSKLPLSQKESTLIHEILHVLNGTLSHTLLDSLSEQLYQVLKDNTLSFENETRLL